MTGREPSHLQSLLETRPQPFPSSIPDPACQITSWHFRAIPLQKTQISFQKAASRRAHRLLSLLTSRACFYVYIYFFLKPALNCGINQMSSCIRAGKAVTDSSDILLPLALKSHSQLFKAQRYRRASLRVAMRGSSALSRDLTTFS